MYFCAASCNAGQTERISAMLHYFASCLWFVTSSTGSNNTLKLTCCKLLQLSKLVDSMSHVSKIIATTTLHAESLPADATAFFCHGSQSCAWGGQMNQFQRTACGAMVAANHLMSETYHKDMPLHAQGGLGGRKQNLSPASRVTRMFNHALWFSKPTHRD